MKIIREVLITNQSRKEKAGDTSVVSSYDDITTTTAHNFMLQAAQKEADEREDVRSISVDSHKLSGRTTATLMLNSTGSAVVYRQEWE